MVKTTNFIAPCILALSSLLQVSCGDCKFEEKRVQAFIADEANQRCETDADCTAASVGCLELEQAFCGQVPMSKRAEKSAEWQQIRSELSDCLSVDQCETCDAELLPQCGEDGRCD